MWRDSSHFNSSGSAVSFTLIQVIAQNQYEWKSEGILADTVQLTEMYQDVLCNRSISISTERKTSNKTDYEQYVI